MQGTTHALTGPIHEPRQQGWDIFRLLPPKPDRMSRGAIYDTCLQLLKITSFLVLFLLTLGASVAGRISFLLIVSGLSAGGKNVTICGDKIPEAEKSVIYLSQKHVAKWAWATLLVLCAPELLCFVKCLHRVTFRNVRRPSVLQFLTVFIVESAYSAGMGCLVFSVIPSMAADTGTMLGSAICLAPAVLIALSRRADRWFLCLVMLDAGAIAAQSTPYWAWPAFVPEVRGHAVKICVCVTLISLAWWQNYVHPQSFLLPIRQLARFALRLNERRSKTYVVVALWKCGVYAFCMFYFLTPKRIPLDSLLQRDPFGEKLITITAEYLNQSQIDAFQTRMREYEAPTNYRIPGNTGGHYKSQAVDSQSNIGRMESNEEITDAKSRPPSSKAKKKWNPDEDPDVINLDEYAGKKSKLSANDGQRKDKQDADKSDKKSALGKGKRSKPHVMTSIQNRTRRSQPAPLSKASGDELEAGEIPAYRIFDDYVELNQFTTPYDALWLALFQIASASLCYMSAKYSCKVWIQRIGFALPMALSTPLTLLLLSMGCERRREDVCYLTALLPKEAFWRCHDGGLPSILNKEYWTDIQTLIWIGWWAAQLWVTIHLWFPAHERLASGEKLFVLSHYSGIFTEQSLALNRRRDDKAKIKCDDLEMESDEYYETVGGGTDGELKAPPSIYSISSSKMEAGLIRLYRKKLYRKPFGYNFQNIISESGGRLLVEGAKLYRKIQGLTTEIPIQLSREVISES